ncbi:MAG TPA: fibronectin type III domain-containing protein, partial [Burkholderiaceae bacterium]|nr:fibronectin type III domain-containing protein [Burkholderiaceae bacterium]
WDHDRAATSYRLERADSDDGPFDLVASLPAPAASYRDDGVEPERRYVYRLYALNAHGASTAARVETTTSALPVLSVSVEGRGGVRSEPAGIDCGGRCRRTSATAGEVVTLFAEGNLARWDGCDAVDGNRCTVTMVRTRSVTATFEAGAPPPPPPGSWGLTVTVEQLGVFIGTTDGRLGCQASAGQPRTCVEYFPAGSTVTLYASPLPGGGVLRLESWQRDCTSYGARSEITLTMDRHYHCSAAFVSGP